MKHSDPYTLLYEDKFLLAVDKSSGIAVTADRWDESKERLDKLLNSFIAREIEKDPEAGQKRFPFPHRVFIVHRIDRDTSGIVLFTKDQESHRELSKAFEGHRIKKSYIAVVHGRPSWKETACDLPLVADGDKKHRTIIDKYQGKKAITNFRYLGGAGNYSIIEALPETGRTHQIRVHLASLGHPIVCDPLYGTSSKGVYLSSFKRGWRGDPIDERPLLSRMGLHAARIGLPALSIKTDAAEETIPPLNLHASLPKDMAALAKQMEKSGSAITGIEDLL
ncbi:RluA family pseudouridine synthase [Breznakiella homolactica]|uniref:RNA pseudouridine synthase n=1 Tax=Breznakiella homolactica TaxID=2798577 RepID=A0A7T7XQH8_9SPIR|nr:RNA pseudouridine synthase [Breznakiella homolactica]QQO10543.1 RNA pseudouridine synthase [Breznakiella homolactica]